MPKDFKENGILNAKISCILMPISAVVSKAWVSLKRRGNQKELKGIEYASKE